LSYQYQQCALCGSKEIEKHSEDHYTCNGCGLGTNGKAANLRSHLKNIESTVIFAKLSYPDLSPEELTNKVQEILHRQENHPLDEMGFCIYCRRSFR